MPRSRIVFALPTYVACVGCAAPPPEHVSPALTSAPVMASTAERITASASASSASAMPMGAPPTSGPCPPDMVLAGRACIDRYEAPNERGKQPLLMQSVSDADAFCQAKEKRLCTENEWIRACAGPQGHKFPYGDRYAEGKCNDVGAFRTPDWKKLGSFPSDEARAEIARLDQSEPSGSRDACVSEEGVFDLAGNAAEWVVRTRDNPTNYSHVVMGCFWGKCFRPPHEPACDYTNYAHPTGFRSYEMGFRCCADPREPSR